MAHHVVRAFVVLALLSAALVAPRSARALEVQVAFDDAGRIQRVDESLARRIGLFVEKYPGFQEARLLMISDSSYVLEISMTQGGRFVREREMLTRDQVDTLRADIARRLAAAAPPPEKAVQEGRAMLLAGSAVLGLGFYGWAVPVIFEVDDPSVALGSYMLTAGASFFLPLVITQNKTVTWGMADLSLYGSTRGIAHGVLLYHAVKSRSGSDEKTILATAMVTSITEGALGYVIARRGRMNAGTAKAIANGGDYGLLWGYLFSDLAGQSDFYDDRSAAITILATTAVGMTGAGLLAAHRAYSYGDGMVLRSTGYVGMLVATAIVDASNPEGSEPYSAGLLAGSAAGLIVGDRLVAGHEFTVGEGVLVELGGLAGALTGLGVVAITNPDGSDVSSAYWIGTALGGTAGYALTYLQMGRRAAARSQDRTSWRFEVTPDGVLAALGHAPGGRNIGHVPHAVRPAPTLARLTCSF